MKFWVVLYTLHVLSRSTVGEQFFYKINMPKCCNVNEMLALNYTCIPDPNTRLYVKTAFNLPHFPDQNSGCVEMLYDERNNEKYLIKIDPASTNNYLFGLNYFPKCCPHDLTYDTVQHRCIPSTKLPSLTEELFKGRLTEGIAIMKIGLGQCETVIADYELPSVRNIIFDANHGVYVPQLQTAVQYGTYCIDKKFNSPRYIVRVCHNDFNVCKTKKSDVKKVRCIRKCCADGEIFQHRPAECVSKFGHGLNLRNDTNIHYPNDPFAIIKGGKCVSYMGTEDDVYHMDVRGNVRLKVEDSPWLFLSPFKVSYCYEYYEEEKMQFIFFCIR